MKRLFFVLSALALLVGAEAPVSAQSVFTHAHMRVPEGHQAEAAEWYQKVLGGELAEIGPGPIVRFDNGFVGTMANDGMAGDSAHSVLDHIGIAVADVRAAVELARRLGAEIRTEPMQTGPNGPTVAHLTDPWGGRFELLEGTGEPLGIHHVHLFSTDAVALRDWFLKVFGGEYQTPMQTPFHRIHYGNMWVHITQAEADDARGPSRFSAADHIGFRVPSLDAFRDKLELSGYAPYLERANPPGADLMFFEGFDGLHVEMTEPAPAR